MASTWLKVRRWRLTTGYVVLVAITAVSFMRAEDATSKVREQARAVEVATRVAVATAHRLAVANCEAINKAKEQELLLVDSSVYDQTDVSALTKAGLVVSPDLLALVVQGNVKKAKLRADLHAALTLDKC